MAGIPRTVRKRPCSCSQWPQDWRRSVFISIPKKGNAEECSNYHTVALISHASKVMVKILQARLQQYVNQELPECTSWVSKRQRNQRSNCQHSMVHKARELQKNTYFCFIDYTKIFDCVGHNKLWKVLKEMGVPEKPERLVCRSRSNS